MRNIDKPSDKDGNVLSASPISTLIGCTVEKETLTNILWKVNANAIDINKNVNNLIKICFYFYIIDCRKYPP